MILLPQRPPQENLLQHTFDLYGDDIVDGVVPSSVGDKSRLPSTGRSFFFDKIDDYINVVGVNQDIKTLSVVIKPSSITVNNYLIKFNATQSIRVINNTVELVGFTGNVYINNVAGNTVDTNWNHLIITTNDIVSVVDLEVGRTTEGYYGGYLYDLQLFTDIKTSDFIKY